MYVQFQGLPPLRHIEELADRVAWKRDRPYLQPGLNSTAYPTAPGESPQRLVSGGGNCHCHHHGCSTLIYNAFAIIRRHGPRGSDQQKRRLLFEGLIISIISIPVGLLAGTAGIGITFAAVSPLLETVFASSTSLRLVVSPISIVAAIACSLLTIFISTWIPARRAAKISPIDAIRQSRDIKLSGKKVRTSKLTRRLFGFEAELGLKNLKRYRRRYRTTVVSLSISIILYLTVAAFAAYAGLSAEMLSEDIIFDIVVNVESSAAKGQEIYQRIAQLDLVDKYAIEHIITGHTWVDAAKASDFVAEKAGPEGKGYRYEVRIQSLDAKAFAQYLRDNGIKMAATGADPGIIINKGRTRDTIISSIEVKRKWGQLSSITVLIR